MKTESSSPWQETAEILVTLLGGRLEVAAVANVATIDDVSINHGRVPGNGYTLVVNATGLSGATSNGFTVIRLGP